MKIERFFPPKSSFLSIEKDLSIIIDQIMQNDRLKRLLYYTSKDALTRPNLTTDQSLEMFGKNIKIVPKLYVDNEVLNYVVINFDNFTPNVKNTEYRDNIVEFDIICHFDQWHMGDFILRPYRIAAEIDSTFDKKHLTGIGTLEFLGANQIVLNDELGGLCLMYEAIHGEEDKKRMPTQARQESYEKDWNNRTHLT